MLDAVPWMHAERNILESSVCSLMPLLRLFGRLTPNMQLSITLPPSTCMRLHATSANESLQHLKPCSALLQPKLGQPCASTWIFKMPKLMAQYPKTERRGCISPDNGPHAAYTRYFGILGHEFGLFGGPWQFRTANLCRWPVRRS